MRKERGQAELIQGGENAVVQVWRQIWATGDTTFKISPTLFIQE